MDTVTNGCYIEQEWPIVDEYGEEMRCTGWIPHLAPTIAGPAALLNLHANDSDRSSFPFIDLPCLPVETAAFPKCP